MPAADDVPPDPSAPEHDKLPDSIRQRLEHLVPELVKKTFAAGMGAVFSTEEGIRNLAHKVSLPETVSSVTGYIADSADGAKDRVFEVIARETREFLGNLNVGEELTKLLTTLSFEIKTEIRFIPNSEKFTGTEPDVKASVRLKRNTETGISPPVAAGKDGKDGKDGKEPAVAKETPKEKSRFWRRGDAEKDGAGADADRDESDSLDK